MAYFSTRGGFFSPHWASGEPYRDKPKIMEVSVFMNNYCPVCGKLHQIKVCGPVDTLVANLQAYKDGNLANPQETFKEHNSQYTIDLLVTGCCQPIEEKERKRNESSRRSESLVEEVLQGVTLAEFVQRHLAHPSEEEASNYP